MTLKFNKFHEVQLVFLLTIFCYSCQPEYYSRPRGYNRIDLPTHNFIPLADTFPYFFEYSKLARILPDTNFNSERWWAAIYYPSFDCSIDLTYKTLENDTNKFRRLIEDVRKLTGKHQIKASSIKEKLIINPHRIYIDVFELEGEVPSPLQFYMSDSTKHFLRGALYFKTATKNDSLAPVIDYLKRDMYHLFETMRWR